MRLRVVVAAAASALSVMALAAAADDRPRGGDRSVAIEEFGALRDEARGMFKHAFSSYMDNAFPWDELKPLSCAGRRWDRRERGTIDDTLGGFALTLVDSLDALAIVGMHNEFHDAVRRVVEHVHFDRDVTVSVFETTIRVLGGLLSAHLLLADDLVPRGNDAETGPDEVYAGELLLLAEDLGERLLPAFDTPTGIPLHRVNLRSGVDAKETPITCSAAAGTMLLELGLLSRLTGRPIFEQRARAAVEALWTRRSSETGLVGNVINARTGHWLGEFTGIAAGVDSFYEYLAKAHVLLDCATQSPFPRAPSTNRKTSSPRLHLGAAFQEARASVAEHLLFGDWHLEVDMRVGRARPRSMTVSALQAFWPGLEAAHAGTEAELAAAAASFDALMAVWDEHAALPEAFDLTTKRAPPHGRSYFLRPELAESALMLFLRTRDARFVAAGARMMHDIERQARVPCGYAALKHVRERNSDAAPQREDRMDSFLLSETLKYLYMIFDAAARNSSAPTTLAPPGRAALFSTEGHLFFVRDPAAAAGSAGGSAAAGSAAAACGDARRGRTEADGELQCGAAASADAPSRRRGRASPGGSVLARVGAERVARSSAMDALSASLGKQERPPAEHVRGMRFAGADFGADAASAEGSALLLAWAEPEDACAPLRNGVALRKQARAAHGLAAAGAPLRLAVLARRGGGCSFVHKAANVANWTFGDAAALIVLNDRDSKPRGMADDGSARFQGPALGGMPTFLAPRELEAHANSAAELAARDGSLKHVIVRIGDAADLQSATQQRKSGAAAAVLRALSEAAGATLGSLFGLAPPSA